MDKQNDDAYKNKIQQLVENLKPIGYFKPDFCELCNNPPERISTGWATVDKVLNGGLYDEFYILAAETSTGKSAFMYAMAQNIAQIGVKVLYFSLEMSKKEFVARGISGLSFVDKSIGNTEKCFTAGDVLYSTYDEQLKTFTRTPYHEYEKYSNEYFEKYGNNLYIIEPPIEGFCAKDIANIACKFRNKLEDKRMVVIIDYMQPLKADPSDRSQFDRKSKADAATIIFKNLSSMGMPVITMSSISRDKYGEKISTNAFKESGDIEYTGGVLLGWNWHGVTDAKNEKYAETEKANCKQRGYRKMNFEVLKFRNSERFNGAKLVYYPAFNCFVDPYDYHLINYEGNNPFDKWDKFEEPKEDDNSDSEDTSSMGTV